MAIHQIPGTSIAIKHVEARMPQQQKRNAQLEDTTRPQGPCPSPQADGDPAVLVAGPHDTPRRAKSADRPADGEPDVNTRRQADEH